MNLIDKDALIESLGIETDCYDCEHERIIYHCDLDPVEACTKIIEAPVIIVTAESAQKAIEVLENAILLGSVYPFEEIKEAVETAIRALQVTSAQPNTCENTYEIECKSNDLISRADAVDAISKIKRTDNWQAAVSMALMDLPSAQPEPEPVGCYGCRYERFGNRVCDVCSRLYADRYSAERRTDE
jgi:hypothetical protein